MHALSIQQLVKRYATGVQALKGIDLTVEPGDFFGLLGPNGAGKSTTISILAGLVTKTSGQVKIFDQDLEHQPARARAQLGLVPQEFNFNMFERVIDILTHQAGYYGMPYAKALASAEYYLDKLGLSKKTYSSARTLSGGQKRRLLIARGLIHQPKLLILDEPTAGVDIELRYHIWTFLQELNQAGTTIILTTHYLEEAENLCKQVAIINDGLIIKNTSVKNLIAQSPQATLVLDLAKPIEQMPISANFTIEQLDEATIQVIIPKGQSINSLFAWLSETGHTVVSLRNKTNRLEELFLNLVKH